MISFLKLIMSFIQVVSLTSTGRQDLAQLLSMGKRKIVSSPRIHVSKPYPRTEGSQYEEDGMEHLDQEVRTCVNIHSETYLGSNALGEKFMAE